jgi:hypothetical protein
MRLPRIIAVATFIALASAGVSFTIPWGEDPSQLGPANRPEMERVGPLTFTISPQGTLFVADTVHESVKEYSADGTYLRTFCTNARPGSMNFDAAGNLLMLDGRDITVWNPAGQRIHAMRVPDEVPLIEGYAQDVFEENGMLCVNDPDEHVYCFPRNVDRPTTTTHVKHGRTHGQHRAFTKSANRREAFVDVGRRGAVVRITPQDDSILGAVLYRGATRGGHPLIEVEELEPTGRVRLKIKQAGPSGVHDVQEFPNDYFTTVYRRFEIQPDGSVWHMRTTPDGVEFNKVEVAE